MMAQQVIRLFEKRYRTVLYCTVLYCTVLLAALRSGQTREGRVVPTKLCVPFVLSFFLHFLPLLGCLGNGRSRWPSAECRFPIIIPMRSPIHSPMYGNAECALSNAVAWLFACFISKGAAAAAATAASKKSAHSRSHRLTPLFTRSLSLCVPVSFVCPPAITMPKTFESEFHFPYPFQLSAKGTFDALHLPSPTASVLYSPLLLFTHSRVEQVPQPVRPACRLGRRHRPAALPGHGQAPLRAHPRCKTECTKVGHQGKQATHTFPSSALLTPPLLFAALGSIRRHVRP